MLSANSQAPMYMYLLFVSIRHGTQGVNMYISIDIWTGMNSNYASGTSVLRVATHAIIVVGLSVMMSGQKRTYSYDYPPV